jgi:ADP-heptose:LPS heptosyltransferase
MDMHVTSQHPITAPGTAPRHLLLSNHQSPGDIIMLTAAVRDLHRSYPETFLTSVQTPFPELWAHNPDITPLHRLSPETERIECHYPLIHRSNQLPRHFTEGFTDHLSRVLNLPIETTQFGGAVYLSAAEKAENPFLFQNNLPVWLIAAGGKRDFTIKWWDWRRYQQVVDHFQGKINFVQIGAASDMHPALDRVSDWRGQTTLRRLAQAMHHADGVLTPVSLPMHLAAAIERPSSARLLPCVVVAGGREPPHWEAYPHHQFIHTVGTLSCCAAGGCWKSRTAPLGDGTAEDLPESLCVDVRGPLPACMDMITPADVIRRIEMYL